MEPQPPPALADGASSSEWTLTKLVTIGGGALTLIFGLLSQLQASGFIPDGSKYGGLLSGGLAIVTALLTVAKALGYTSSRTTLKLGELQAQAAVQVAQAKATAPALTAAPASAPSPQ